jgi:hypothetical protein
MNNHVGGFGSAELKFSLLPASVPAEWLAFRQQLNLRFHSQPQFYRVLYHYP